MTDQEGLRSVGDVAALTGVTVRTLHYYEEIGLLVPAQRTATGYRRYGDDEVLRLHEIITWRGLGVPLDEIARVLDDPDHDPLETLRHHRRRLEAEVDRVGAAIDTIDEAIKKREEGTTMTDDELIQIFDGFDPAEHDEEVEERWGGTGAYEVSMRRAKAYRPEEWKAIKEEGSEINQRFVHLLSEGVPADSPEARDAAVAHRDHISRWFYEVTPEIHRGLAEMYVSDPRFTATYENTAEGLARYVHDAIVAST